MSPNSPNQSGESSLSDPKAQYVLGIELSNPSGASERHAVALWESASNERDSGFTARSIGLLVDSLPIPEKSRSADVLMEIVRVLCTRNEIIPSQISTILVSVGPGGYTSLRISTTSAKVLAMSLQAELIGVPSDRVAECAFGSDQRPSIIALASKGLRTCATLVGSNNELKSLGSINAHELVEMIDIHEIKSIACDSHLPDSFKELAQKHQIEMVEINLDARSLARASEGIEGVSAGNLSPIYAREPDAVTQWRARRAES